MAQENGFSPTYLLSFVEVGKKRNKVVHLLGKNVVNMI